MRSTSSASIPVVAMGLTLLVSSVAAAQSATPPPEKYGAALSSSVVTSALDPASLNSTIEETVRAMHLELDGKLDGKQGGYQALPPQPDTTAVIDAVLERANLNDSVVVVSGGDSQAGVGIALNFTMTSIIDVGQSVPCVTDDGQPDPSGTCAGSEYAFSGNYTAVDFAVEDGAYLAGLYAAAAARNGRLGIISGSPDCRTCNRYVQGFVNGARSYDPDVDIELAYLADDEVAGFGDPVSAKTFTRAFIDVYQPDVLLPVGRGASIGMIEAVCEREAGTVLAIGTGTDVAATNPELGSCILTSVSLDVAEAVNRALQDFANREQQSVLRQDLNTGLVSVVRPTRSLPVDTAERYQAAETAIRTDQIDTCPIACGDPVDLEALAGDVAVTDPGADPEAEGEIE